MKTSCIAQYNCLRKAHEDEPEKTSSCITVDYAEEFLAVYTFFFIRPSVDGLCKDGTSDISRDPRIKRLQTQPKRLGWL